MCSLRIARHDHAAELPVVEALVVVLVVPQEDEVRLVSVVVAVADVAEEALTELSLREGLKSSIVEQSEGTHGRVVNPVGKFAFQFLNFLLKVDLVKEGPSHFFFHSPVSCEALFGRALVGCEVSLAEVYGLIDVLVWLLRLDHIDEIQLFSFNRLFLLQLGLRHLPPQVGRVGVGVLWLLRLSTEVGALPERRRIRPPVVSSFWLTGSYELMIWRRRA